MIRMIRSCFQTFVIFLVDRDFSYERFVQITRVHSRKQWASDNKKWRRNKLGRVLSNVYLWDVSLARYTTAMVLFILLNQLFSVYELEFAGKGRSSFILRVQFDLNVESSSNNSSLSLNRKEFGRRIVRVICGNRWTHLFGCRMSL